MSIAGIAGMVDEAGGRRGRRLDTTATIFFIDEAAGMFRLNPLILAWLAAE